MPYILALSISFSRICTWMLRNHHNHKMPLWSHLSSILLHLELTQLCCEAHRPNEYQQDPNSSFLTPPCNSSEILNSIFKSTQKLTMSFYLHHHLSYILLDILYIQNLCFSTNCNNYSNPPKDHGSTLHKSPQISQDTTAKPKILECSIRLFWTWHPYYLHINLSPFSLLVSLLLIMHDKHIHNAVARSLH